MWRQATVRRQTAKCQTSFGNHRVRTSKLIYALSHRTVKTTTHKKTNSCSRLSPLQPRRPFTQTLIYLKKINQLMEVIISRNPANCRSSDLENRKRKVMIFSDPPFAAGLWLRSRQPPRHRRWSPSAPQSTSFHWKGAAAKERNLTVTPGLILSLLQPFFSPLVV